MNLYKLQQLVDQIDIFGPFCEEHVIETTFKIFEKLSSQLCCKNIYEYVQFYWPNFQQISNLHHLDLSHSVVVSFVFLKMLIYKVQNPDSFQLPKSNSSIVIKTQLDLNPLIERFDLDQYFDFEQMNKKYWVINFKTHNISKFKPKSFFYEKSTLFYIVPPSSKEEELQFYLSQRPSILRLVQSIHPTFDCDLDKYQVKQEYENKINVLNLIVYNIFAYWEYQYLLWNQYRKNPFIMNSCIKPYTIDMNQIEFETLHLIIELEEKIDYNYHHYQPVPHFSLFHHEIPEFSHENCDSEIYISTKFSV